MRKKIVGIIPIKLKNQRLPGKNTMELGGKPLCRHLFDTVKNINSFDEIYVYCSDELIENYIPEGIKYLKRSKQLDENDVKSKDILQAFINVVDADIYVLMHVTQPFIEQKTIENAIEQVVYGNFDSAFAAHEIKEFVWYNNKPLNYELTDVVRTQELKPVYTEGELFIFEKDVFTKHGRRIGFNPYIQSISWKENVCIDTIEDFQMAQAIIEMMKNRGAES